MYAATQICTPHLATHSTSKMPRRNQSGRIEVHQRTVDDRTDILYAGATLAHEHTNEITVTEQSQMEDRTRREYHNRIWHIYR